MSLRAEQDFPTERYKNLLANLKNLQQNPDWIELMENYIFHDVPYYESKLLKFISSADDPQAAQRIQITEAKVINGIKSVNWLQRKLKDIEQMAQVSEPSNKKIDKKIPSTTIN